MLDDTLFSEPVFVSDIFASGIGDVEDLGDGNVRITFYSRQKSHSEMAGCVENIIVNRTVLPAGALLCGIRRIVAALGMHCCGPSRKVN